MRSVTLTSSHAEISFDCGGDSGGGKGWFPTPDGGRSNYQKAHVRGVRSIRVPGTTITGHGARADFVLIPDNVTCRKTAGDSELKCSVHKSDGSTLSGSRRRRRRGG